MADDASDGEVEDDADWRARVRRLRPFLLDADLVPPPPNPPDASSNAFASWTRLHAKAPEPPGGFASDAGAKALDALLRDRRQAAPGAFARQCAALGGLDARRSHVLCEGELDIPTEDYYDTARALQNQRWSRQRAGRARQLRVRLFHMVAVEVRVAEGMHELAGLKIADLGDHQRQQRVGGNIERHPQEDIAAALVELAAQLAVGHIELEQAVARRQRLAAIGGVVARRQTRVGQHRRVPGAHHQPA